MKDIIYLEDSLKRISDFPVKAKQRMMVLLDGLRVGIQPHPNEFKYIPIVGKGVYELRVRYKASFRVFYVTKFNEGIYVLHGFVKKTKKTSQQDIQIGMRRYKELLQARTAR